MIHVTILMITLKLWIIRHEKMEYLYVYLKSNSNPAKRVAFITEQNASMISQHRLEVRKIVKSSWIISRTSKLSVRYFNFLCVLIKFYLILSYFIPSPTTKGITKYDTLFEHTQPPLLYSWSLQDLMEEQNLYMLHILNW